MEQAPDETPAYANPVYDEADGLLCSKWNRNRIQIAQRIDGVPPLTAGQREAMDALDEVLRRPELMFEMYLQPGDVRILNNHVTLHPAPSSSITKSRRAGGCCSGCGWRRRIRRGCR